MKPARARLGAIAAIPFLLALMGTLILVWLPRRSHSPDDPGVSPAISRESIPASVDVRAASGVGGGQPAVQMRPDGRRGGEATVIGRGDRLDSSRLDDPVYRVRFERHKRVVQYLNSPGRQTVECRQIERLCQAYGYGVWAVGAAYSLAFEHAANELILEKSEGRFFPEGEEAIRHLNETMLAGRIEDLAHRLGVRWDPQFLVELMQIRPTAFFGQALLAGNDGDPLLDRLEWGEAPPPGTAWGPGFSAGR